jgi:hypothetical protein
MSISVVNKEQPKCLFFVKKKKRKMLVTNMWILQPCD